MEIIIDTAKIIADIIPIIGYMLMCIVIFIVWSILAAIFKMIVKWADWFVSYWSIMTIGVIVLMVLIIIDQLGWIVIS